MLQAKYLSVPKCLTYDSTHTAATATIPPHFHLEHKSTVVAYSYADYREYARGLQQVGTKVAYSLFGNGTDLSSNVSVKPGDSLFISGKWFHPGIVYVKFDGVNVVGTVTGQEWQSAQVLGSTTASQTGSFQTYVTIPTASGGVHYLAIEDYRIKINNSQ